MGGISPLAAREHCPRCVAQAIFDEEPAAESEGTEEKAEVIRAQPKSTTALDENTDKGKKKKKKRARKKRKQNEPETASAAALPDYSPQELARQSYAWAPEGELQLKSSVPGLKSSVGASAKTAPAPTTAVPTTVVEEERVRTQAFKLPQIPLTQVLIVGVFVVLFLLYRLQVGRQIKRRKY